MKTEKTKKAKRRYNKEFKESILKLAEESQDTLVQIANDVGVHPKTLCSWVNKEKSLKFKEMKFKS